MTTQNGRTVGLPRGLLRFLVLNMLREKSLSGTEIVEIIENQTEGNWKPSPGSIYPLLAWLSDKGFTKELPRAQDGLKRYSFTELGNKFLDSLRQADMFIHIVDISGTTDAEGKEGSVAAASSADPV